MSDVGADRRDLGEKVPLARIWPVEKLVAILEAEPWLLHRRVECVNVSCEQGGWCVGCDPWGEAPCSEHPWPCPVVRGQDPAFAAGRAQAAADIRALIPCENEQIVEWLRSHGLGMAGPGAVLAALRHDVNALVGAEGDPSKDLPATGAGDGESPDPEPS